MGPPQDFDGWWHVFLALVEIHVDETVIELFCLIILGGGDKFYFLMSTIFLEYFFGVKNEYQNDFWWKSIFGRFTGGSQILNLVKIGQFWSKNPQKSIFGF